MNMENPKTTEYDKKAALEVKKPKSWSRASVLCEHGWAAR